MSGCGRSESVVCDRQREEDTRRLSSEEWQAVTRTRRTQFALGGPVTAGVPAEARQQIVGPESPVILASDELLSDVTRSSGLREEFGDENAHMRRLGGSIRSHTCVAGRAAAISHGPGQSSWRQELLLLVSLATSSICEIPAGDSGFSRPLPLLGTVIHSSPLNRANPGGTET